MQSLAAFATQCQVIVPSYEDGKQNIFSSLLVNLLLNHLLLTVQKKFGEIGNKYLGGKPMGCVLEYYFKFSMF